MAGADGSQMKMEIKVDVHTVHPSQSSCAGAGGDVLKGPTGPWCTPHDTPTHAALNQTNHGESKCQISIDESNKRNVPQKNRIFVTSPPEYSAIEEFHECSTELKQFKIDAQNESSVIDETSVKNIGPPPASATLPVEPLQSPVPSSPEPPKRFKGFSLSIFDLFQPIDPQGRGYISWLFLVTFCYGYNAWCIALRVAFPYQTAENTPVWMCVDYFCDAVYLVDVALVKPKLMFLHEGFWVDDPVETRKFYRKKLQFKFDVISLLPLDLLYIYFGTQMVILRFPRLLKLQTFWEFHQAMDRVLSSPYIVRVGKTLFYIFYLIHLNACAYYAMSAYIGLGSDGWVYDNQGNAYIRCFYFATKTATSIGKIPKPEKTEEYLFMTVAWLKGVFVFALLIGQIRVIIATATRARTEYRKRVDGCTQYLRNLNLPSTLQRRVTAWYAYTWKQQRCFDEATILNSLPFNMKRDVALAVHISTLSKVQLFKDCSDSLLRDLVLQLKPVTFLPGDIVVRKGDVGHHMYIIKSGQCYVMYPDEHEVVAILGEGSVFGEISLLGIEGLRRRTATVRSRGYSSLFALSRTDLDVALKQHKEAAQILRLRADAIIRENAARNAARAAQARLARKASSSQQATDARRRRLSSASSADSAAAPRNKPRSTSALSRRKLSVVSEDKVSNEPRGVPAPASSAPAARTPLPTIVLTGE